MIRNAVFDLVFFDEIGERFMEPSRTKRENKYGSSWHIVVHSIGIGTAASLTA